MPTIVPILAIVFGFGIPLWLHFHEKGKIREIHQDRVARFEQADRRGMHATSPLVYYVCGFGGAFGRSGNVALGTNYIFLNTPDMAADEYMQISYGEIASLDIDAPNLPYVMNLNAAALLANAATKNQAGLNVLIAYQEGRLHRRIVLGGFSRATALSFVSKIEAGMNTFEG